MNKNIKLRIKFLNKMFENKNIHICLNEWQINVKDIPCIKRILTKKKQNDQNHV